MNDFYKDEDLVLGCINGEQRYFTMLFDKYYRIGIIVTRKYHPNIHVVEDIVMESFVKAFNSIKTLKEPNKFFGWFLVILKNHAIRTLTAKEERKRLNTISIHKPIKADETKSYFDVYPKGAYYDPTIKYDYDIIMKKINSLSEQDSRCLIGLIDGYKLTELAKMYNVNNETMKSHAFRCKKKLKNVNWLSENYSDIMK